YNPRGSHRLFPRVAPMSFKLDRVHVWAGEVADQAGGVASKLSMLAQAGSNLEYILTRRQSDKPGTGVLYVAPVTGPYQVRAAKAGGLHETHDTVVLRVEGDNEAGLGFKLTQQWALAGISLQGLTMAVLGNKFVGSAPFGTVADATGAAQILAGLGSGVGTLPSRARSESSSGVSGLLRQAAYSARRLAACAARLSYSDS